MTENSLCFRNTDSHMKREVSFPKSHLYSHMKRGFDKILSIKFTPLTRPSRFCSQRLAPNQMQPLGFVDFLRVFAYNKNMADIRKFQCHRCSEGHRAHTGETRWVRSGTISADTLKQKGQRLLSLFTCVCALVSDVI